MWGKTGIKGGRGGDRQKSLRLEKNNRRRTGGRLELPKSLKERYERGGGKRPKGDVKMEKREERSFKRIVVQGVGVKEGGEVTQGGKKERGGSWA